MTPQPTPAELEAANSIADWMGYARVDVSTRLAQIIVAHRAPADGALRNACRKLISYRDRNTLNFQLEKADDFIHQMRTLLDSEPADPAQAHAAENEVLMSQAANKIFELQAELSKLRARITELESAYQTKEW